jgi:hypothetical protein
VIERVREMATRRRQSAPADTVASLQSTATGACPGRSRACATESGPDGVEAAARMPPWLRLIRGIDSFLSLILCGSGRQSTVADDRRL